jgi:ferredoxin
MEKKSVILHFGSELVDKPIMSGLIKHFDISVNILQASITPEEDGTMFVQIEGEKKDVQKAIDYLEKKGVSLILPAKNLILDDKKCTHCGACTAQCLSNALQLDSKTGKLSLNHNKCIACELCIPACPYRALKSVTDMLA